MRFSEKIGLTLSVYMSSAILLEKSLENFRAGRLGYFRNTFGGISDVSD